MIRPLSPPSVIVEEALNSIRIKTGNKAILSFVHLILHMHRASAAFCIWLLCEKQQLFLTEIYISGSATSEKEFLLCSSHFSNYTSNNSVILLLCEDYLVMFFFSLSRRQWKESLLRMDYERFLTINWPASFRLNI